MNIADHIQPIIHDLRMGLARAVRSASTALTSVASRIEPTPDPPPPRVIRPRPGPQTEFLASAADVAFMVGGPWTGKTTALFLDWMRHVNNPDARGLFVCNRATVITIRGGLWDTAREFYAGTGASFKAGRHHRLVWPSGAILEFRHIDNSNSKWFGGIEFGWIGIHDAHEINAKIFAALVRCSRATPGHRPPRIRACSDSWEPWMDQMTLGVELIRATEADVIPPDGMTREQAIDRLRMGGPNLWVAS